MARPINKADDAMSKNVSMDLTMLRHVKAYIKAYEDGIIDADLFISSMKDFERNLNDAAEIVKGLTEKIETDRKLNDWQSFYEDVE